MQERLQKTGIVPVLHIADATKAIPLADALHAGGLDVLEVTFRTDAAPQAIECIAKGRKDSIRGDFNRVSVEEAETLVRGGAGSVVR